jgi:acyl-CoA thioester hydrolase
MPSPAVHALPLRVYAADTDASGIVHHAQYLVFAERARTEMLRDHGLALDTLADVAAGFWVVRGVSATYRQPARLDDEVIMLSRVVGVRGASCDIEQRATRGSDVLAEMRLTVAYLTADGRPRRQPPEWRARLETLAAEARGAW